MINPDLLTLKGQRLELYNAKGPCTALYISELFARSKKNILVITDQTQSAKQLLEELIYLNSSQAVSSFPDYETLPYDIFSPQQELISDRLEALYTLKTGIKNITVAPISAALMRLPPEEFVLSNALVLKKGQVLSMSNLIALLGQNGYTRVTQVYGSGEFAVRGSIIDLFPSGMEKPFRLDFFDDEIDSIKSFDVENQRSLSTENSIRLLPAREFPIQVGDIERFRSTYRDNFGTNLDPDSVYQQVTAGHIPAGIEYYLPLFYEKTCAITDYLPQDTIVVLACNTIQQASEFFSYVQQRYASRATDESQENDLKLRPRLKPEQIYYPKEEFFHLLKDFTMVVLKDLEPPSAKASAFEVAEIANVALQEKNEGLKELQKYLSGCTPDQRFLFTVYSKGRVETVSELLKAIDVKVEEFGSIKAFSASDERFGILISPFDHGLYFKDSKIHFISETELFGASYVKTRRNNKNVQADAIIRNLAELKIGDKIVHYKYGIGCYQGLEIQNINGVNKEFFCLEYAEKARLYVEITELHLISRYTGGSNPKLSTLGTDTWEKNRKKTQERVKDVAVQLLDIYSKRAIKQGFAFKLDKKAYNNFAAGFGFEETEDQKRAIAAVIHDMTSERTMDRLICGDVGFGKTEVAIRAAFIAAYNHKQTAILVPTVLLAEQHYETFKSRFANEGVNIEVLSRFKTSNEQLQVLKDLQQGKIDIIIGTHKLLSKNIKYRDLGLLIVDEEHRFGVKQKETIKAWRSEVDILTLTATPIPRTLNMAFSGLRDLSLITTPPAKRLAIKTFLKPNDNNLVREAIIRELKRGGQVYYLHNDTLTIEKRAEDLANLVPEAKIDVAHGQMNARHLGVIMNNFYHHKFNVLVCTTIIETGIDVPAANTIIIERADKFGLAQLHQIRGRVGRSNQQAYAYLLTPPTKLITKDAIKRLEAISKHDDLGVGFTLANHDLEIRGAGELLGDEQSGQIATVGFTLYMDMLNNAISALKSGQELSLMDLSARSTEINLNVPAVIPSDYISDISTRLSFYKQISSAEEPQALTDIRDEIIDRYGDIPDEVRNLFKVNQIRMRSTAMGIECITISKVTNFLRFSNHTTVQPAAIVELFIKFPQLFKMDGPNKIRILKKIEPVETLEFVQDLLSMLEDPKVQSK